MIRIRRASGAGRRAGAVSVAVLVLLAIAYPSLARLVSPVESASDFQEATVERVVDGDTIEAIVDGQEAKVRLIGIDAPESVNPDASKNSEEGEESSSHLKSSLAQGTRIWLQKDVSDTDKYGRLLRYVWLDLPDQGKERDADQVAAKMLNAQIVEQGWAQAKDFPPDSSYSDVFADLGRRAISDGAGVSSSWS